MKLTSRFLRILLLIVVVLTAFTGGYSISSLVCDCDRTIIDNMPVVLGIFAILLAGAAERKKKQELKNS
ncbi:hypothetical protein ACFLT1_07430 [Bacteroidota bacterium]